MKLDWQHWLYGLAAAVIGGGASAVTAGIGASMLAPGQFNLSGEGWNVFKLVSLVFAINGMITAMAYLKQSPLPAIESSTSVTVKVETTKQPPEAT
jgi:hypothetical protein